MPGTDTEYFEYSKLYAELGTGKWGEQKAGFNKHV